MAGIAGLVSNSQAKAQLTVKALLKNAVSDATDEQYPHVAEAITRFTNKDVKGALAELTVAKNDKERGKKLPPAEMMMANMLLMVNQGNPARGELEECIKNNPDDPEAYLVLADMAFNDRQVAAADLLFAKADQLAATYVDNPKRDSDFKARAKAGLAAVAESREQWDAAEKYLTAWLKVVDPNPTNEQSATANTAGANAHDRLGRVLFHADQSIRRPTEPARPTMSSSSRWPATNDRSRPTSLWRFSTKTPRCTTRPRRSSPAR